MRETTGDRGKRRNETYFWASGHRGCRSWGHPRPSAHSVKLYAPFFPSSLPGLPSAPPPTTPRAWTAWSLPRGEGPAKSPLLPHSSALASFFSPPAQFWVPAPQSQAFGVPSLKLPMPPGFVRPWGPGAAARASCPSFNVTMATQPGSPRRASRPPQRGREQSSRGEREGRPRTGKLNQRETADKEPPNKGR